MLLAQGSANAFVQLITVLVIFVVVLVITLFVTRWIAGFQKEQMSGSNMQVIETMRLTPNQFVQIIKVGNQYMAIAVSKDHVEMLTKLDESELDLTNKTSNQLDFAAVLKQFKGGLSKDDKTQDASSEDE